ncbi:MAG: chemotaxis response regulator protein-glutamate methylesterase, partial [Alphaproteobacteria bacterium]|nr:chemotaxis response regulator protein-glutamate methylesterase [Alphaproteobacteria bacterium]
EKDPEVKVVASVGDGKMAIDTLKRHEVDVTVLDIEMPVMDGLTALPLLLEVKPGLPIIMASTLTRKNAEVSMRALALGAKDYVTKPSTASELTSATAFQQELIAKVRALAGRRRAAAPTLPAAPRAESAAAHPVPEAPKPPPLRPSRSATITLRHAHVEHPEVLAIGSSTGGPQALFNVVGNLSKDVKQPILITQHMPATFTTILAEHLTRVSNRPCAEAKDGESIEPGRIYVAPGDFHMVVEGGAGKRVLRLLKTPPENFCRPAVDPMLRSIAESYGKRVLVAILTGMGYDGQKGAEKIIAAGGTVIAQDEASSVVWGMPGAVATAGLCTAVLPIGEIGPYLQRAALRLAS